MLQALIPGDVVYVAAADRLGDNMRDFLKVVHLMEDLGADLVILQENVDTRDSSGRAALRLLKSVANIDFHFQSQSKKIGIETARLQGRRIGRPPVPIPPGFRDICRQWSEGRISAAEAMRRSGLRSTSFYKKARELGFVAPSKRLRQESKSRKRHSNRLSTEVIRLFQREDCIIGKCPFKDEGWIEMSEKNRNQEKWRRSPAGATQSAARLKSKRRKKPIKTIIGRQP